MATWSAFGVGGLDPIGTLWQRNLDRKDAKWSIHQQKEYDQWKAGLDYSYDLLRAGELYPFAYSQDLRAQRSNYALEQGLRTDRTVDSVMAERQALEAAGFNPLLAVDNVAGYQSASPLVSGAFHSAASSGGHSVGGIIRSPSANSGISGSTPWDWASAKQSLENQEATGRLIDAQEDETRARAEVARNSAAKIKKETELTGFENPSKSLTTITKGLMSEVDKGDDAFVPSTARSFIDAVDSLVNPVKEDNSGSGLSRNLIKRMDDANIPWMSLPKAEALKLLKEYNEKKKAK